jgi:N-methylhydantoinase A/oxoprolinase/acetone carboxylase beta subunit
MGPMIIEQDDTTTVIETGMVARADDLGNLVIKSEEQHDA